MDPLRCTVVDAADPRTSVDLDVHTPPAATLGEVVRPLLETAGLPVDRMLHAGGSLIDPATPIGVRPLVDGVLLVACPPGTGKNSRIGGTELPPAPAVSSSVLRLCVVGGPDSGRTLALAPGRHVIGRSPEASLTLDDPDLSRRHLAVTVTPEGLLVHDLGSTNGTFVDDRPIGSAGSYCRPGQRLTAGSSTFVVRLIEDGALPVEPDGGGRLVVRGRRRPPSSPPELVVARESEPTERPRAPLPWLAIMAPMLMGVAMAWFLRQPGYLAFAVLGPVTALASTVTDRRGRRRERRRERERWLAQDGETSRRIEQALADELALRRRSAPDPVQLASCAAVAGQLLWHREPTGTDLLDVCLGTATTASCVRVQQPGAAGQGGAVSAVAAGSEGPQARPLHCAPAVVRLLDVGHLALTGDRHRRLASARWVVGQLAVAASPLALVIEAVDDGDDWRWVRWLPHRRRSTLAALEREVRSRLEWQAAPPTLPRVVVVVPDVERRAGDAALRRLLDDGPAVGMHVVCTAATPAEVPSGVGAVLSLPRAGRGRLHRAADHETLDVWADGVGRGWADRVGRALAALREAPSGSDGALPAVVRLGPLLGADVRSADELASAWRERPRSTRAVLGVDGDGVMAVDLVRDGPHVLIAGTTGSGKSELLQTLVASLAVANRPDELAFVLVDYKGGAAFAGCSALPHVSGLVSDLDERLAARALASLQAELTRRERVLAGAGATDIDAYQQQLDAGADRPRLGRLVIVIDEFRLLATELPDFLEGLVRLAAVGRSLGVHLVLATQRPAGIVSADIRANVNLRICLRVRDRSDSHDVLDAPDAALLPEGVPGRALLRTGAGPLVALQVGLVGGPADPPVRDHVVVVPAGQRPLPLAEGPDHLEVLATEAREAARLLDAVAPPSPWLLPLPDVVTTAALDAHDPVPGGGIGLIDLPDEGRQPLLRWDARSSSHLSVSGTSRSGRSCALLTVVLSAVRADPDLHVHLIDAGTGVLTRALAGCAQVGTLLTGDQPRRTRRLVARLADALSTIPSTTATAIAAPTLLVIDGWEALVQQHEAVEHGRGIDELLSLVRDQESAGLRLLVAGGRGVLTSRLASLVAERIVLRCADPTDLLLAGAPSATTPAHQPPGRGLHLPSGHEVQLAWPGDPDDVRDQLSQVPPPARPPLLLPALPERVALDDLPTTAEHRHRVVVGIGGDEVQPLTLDLAGLVGVVGPPGSGRSTVLAAFAQQLRAASVPLRSLSPSAAAGTKPWHLEPDSEHLPPRSATPRVVLVDDADLAPASDIEAAVQAGDVVVVATTPAHLAGAYTGWAGTLRRQRTGLLLQPSTAHDGEPFGIRAEPPDRPVPGRGQLIRRGRAVDVQVAMPRAAVLAGVGGSG